MAGAQPDLFGEGGGGPSRYQVKPEHVRNRLVEMVAAMRGAGAWPWSASRTRLFRETVWPCLLSLPPEDEAAEWRARLDAEAIRLDALAG